MVMDVCAFGPQGLICTGPLPSFSPQYLPLHPVLDAPVSFSLFSWLSGGIDNQTNRLSGT